MRGYFAHEDFRCVDNSVQQNITRWWVYDLCSVLFKQVNQWVNQFPLKQPPKVVSDPNLQYMLMNRASKNYMIMVIKLFPCFVYCM